MNIAYVSRYNAIDIKNWSGSEYFIAKALENQANEMHYITDLRERLNIATRLKFQVHTRLGKQYFINRSPFVAKKYALQLEKKLNSSDEIVFSPGTMPLAYLETKTPKVFYTDATFASMIGYYDWYKNLSKLTCKEGHKLEQKALDSSSLAIFSSDWAAQGAINYYNISPDKIKVVPLGANIQNEKSLSEIQHAIVTRDSSICKILFIGVDWIRKGGDKVLNTVNLMNKMGLRTEMHVIGIPSIPTMLDQKHIINHGFISKESPEGLAKFERLILSCHFLFVPSLVEAYGIVFCEAAAYGLPAIGSKTGGIPTIIKDGINGKTFDLETCTEEYANYLSTLFDDKVSYSNLALSSFAEYKSRLNWNVAGKQLTDYMRAIL